MASMASRCSALLALVTCVLLSAALCADASSHRELVVLKTRPPVKPHPKPPVKPLPKPPVKPVPKPLPKPLPKPVPKVLPKHPPPPPCRPRLHRPKVVKVGGALGWNFNVQFFWKPPPMFVGDQLYFNWPPVAGIDHNVWCMPNWKAYHNCDFSYQCELGDQGYTTPRFTHPGWYYYACEEGTHCQQAQKIAIYVRPAPKFDPCPLPPRPAPPVKKPPPTPHGPKRVIIGTYPQFWALGLTQSWRPPVVHTGDTLVFRWTALTSAPPHDVWFMDKSDYGPCTYASPFTHRLAPLTATGVYSYKVTAAKGTTLYFACAYTFHCLVGMKTAITVT